MTERIEFPDGSYVELTDDTDAGGHVCSCATCDALLNPETAYQDFPPGIRTAPEHLGIRFGDWTDNHTGDPWFPIRMNGEAVPLIYEVDKARGRIWAYRPQPHLCVTCLRRGASAAQPCAVLLTGTVTFGAMVERFA